LNIPYPSLIIQKRISKILSAYDDLIENNTRRIRILEEMAQAIYREWFVAFRFPGHEGVRRVESAMGRIPEGWEIKKLGEMMELAYGKGLKSEVRKPGQIPVFGSAGVVGFHDESLVNGPGIIVGRKGNVGSIFWTYVNFYPIDTVFYVKTALPLLYVYYNLRTQNFINNDAAVPGLSRNQAYLLPFLVPQTEILRRFSNFIEPMFREVDVLQKKNNNLRKQRDLLLPLLVNGELII
jgi:type I restriction enzyme, S subunit